MTYEQANARIAQAKARLLEEELKNNTDPTNPRDPLDKDWVWDSQRMEWVEAQENKEEEVVCEPEAGDEQEDEKKEIVLSLSIGEPEVVVEYKMLCGDKEMEPFRKSIGTLRDYKARVHVGNEQPASPDYDSIVEAFVENFSTDNSDYFIYLNEYVKFCAHHEVEILPFLAALYRKYPTLYRIDLDGDIEKL